MTLEAVSAGLPVFVEKPLTCDLRRAERLFDEVSAKGGYVLVDHVHLFSHAYRGLKTRLPSVEPIAHIRTEAGAWGPFRPDTPVLRDWGPHDAAFCVDLLGPQPGIFRAEHVERPLISRTYGETIALRGAYPNGITVDILLSNVLASKRRWLLVEGHAASLVYDDCAERKLTYMHAEPLGARADIPDVRDTPPLYCALSQFVTNIATDRMSLDDLRFGVEVVRLLNAWQTVLSQ